jgi:hypothetical protein
MWSLLRNTNTSSRRRGHSISKHINGLGRNKNVVTGPKPRMTVLARPPAISFFKNFLLRYKIGSSAGANKTGEASQSSTSVSEPFAGKF